MMLNKARLRSGAVAWILPLLIGSPVLRAQDNAPSTRTYHEKGLAWSPDGTRIAYFSNRTGNDEIFVRDLASGREQQLTDNNQVDRWPNWSPDGQRIAFVARAGTNWDIYTMRADGGNRTRVTTAEGNDLYPTWTKDGRSVIWASAGSAGGDLTLRRRDLDQDGEGVSLPLSLPIAGPASLSPDGKRLLFGSYGSDSLNKNIDVYLAGADGRGARRLTTSPAAELGAAWSPDGTQIAYLTDAGGGNVIWIMNADGSGSRETALHASFDGGPKWSPDGRSIGSHQNTERGERLHVLDVATNTVREMQSSGGK